MYRLVRSKSFDKTFKKLDKHEARLVLKYIKNNIDGIEDPRSKGRALAGGKKGYWRYRIGNYRLICKIEDDKLLILALSVGHRREIYK